ncbi:hypothetical protein IKF27_00060 [Candidatus Saccharibacteria bacterium]|nr:hypothetical protein [Candidatus Saccharibacteria bacterium]
MTPEEPEKKNYNLLWLGIGATLIALLTTGISIIIYHKSGDIYLDRSRPGFLPDKEEIENRDDDEEYLFSENGPITKYDLDEYLKMFNEELNDLDELKKPYSAEPLSDDALGIPPKKVEPAPAPAEEETEEY